MPVSKAPATEHSANSAMSIRNKQTFISLIQTFRMTLSTSTALILLQVVGTDIYGSPFAFEQLFVKATDYIETLVICYSLRLIDQVDVYACEVRQGVFF